jgi:hypothetical protein
MLPTRLIVRGIALSAVMLLITEAGDYFIFDQEPQVSLKEVGIALLLGSIYTFFPWLLEQSEREQRD